MYKTVKDAVEFAQAFKPLVVGSTHCDIVVGPAFTALKTLADRLEGSNVHVAAQDLAADTGPGAFTGEVSATMILEAGGRYAIIGHSERRQYYGETDDSVNKKILAALSAGLLPIVCVGELLEHRDAGRAEELVGGQLTQGMHNLTLSDASRIIVAYEPVWAIGTGKTATPEMAVDAHKIIRAEVAKLLGADVAAKMRILYGGSVKPDNATALCGEEEIDGALVGGASLKPDSFTAIVKY